MTRRPAALVAPPLARLVAYVLLAALGAAEWNRYVDGAPAGRAVAWVAAGAATMVLVLLAARVRGRWRTLALIAAPLAGALLAVAASGLDFHYLKPHHWDELGDGLDRGMSALNTVRLPYTGKEDWVLRTVQLTGAGLCWAAGWLTAWPHGRGARRCALILLLVLAVSPIVSLGVHASVAIGLAFAVLTVAFLWLERLSRRPGLGLAVVGVVALLFAVPVGRAADRDTPLFDYKAFSEKLSGGAPVSFQWDHSYGPIDWPRDGADMFHVRTNQPHYYKAETLDTFDGRGWTTVVRPFGSPSVGEELPRTGKDNPDWDVSYAVSIRRLEAGEVMGSGTTLSVDDSTRPTEPALTPGEFEAADGRVFKNGDSYTVKARVPAPTEAALSKSTSGNDPRRASSLVVHVGIRPDAASLVPTGPIGETTDEADVRFPPFADHRPPEAYYSQWGGTGPGPAALQASYYEPMWRLAQRLKARSKTPYAYVLAVNNYLRSPRFTYTEKPKVAADVPPLEEFLFVTHAGYCQQFSGAMALLLRMGGVPARVAAGFTPGGQRPGTDEWVVRDTDAHSWVEAWFDDIGWVTFDPTPPATPARSQIAAIDPPVRTGGSDTQKAGRTGVQPDARRAGEINRNTLPAIHNTRRDQGGRSPLVYVALVLLVLLALAGAALVWRGRAEDTDAALAELERAVRRTGRAHSPQTTLRQLEQRLGSSGYLQALQAARYGTGAPPPSRAQRAAFRRDLVRGLGLGRRLRVYQALPPLPPRTLRSRRPS